jgi:aldehyde dehydrogenase (NAD+)
VETTSPVNGGAPGRVTWVDGSSVDDAVTRAQAAFQHWRGVPAPVRGALVKRLGELLAVHKNDLATLISLEVGKITSEARGEVQEMIDICDFAVGLSRQLYGRTMTSERPGHRLMETWHPLGVVGVISAFNFPSAVWSWNTAIALVCGDPRHLEALGAGSPLTALAQSLHPLPGHSRLRRARRPQPGAHRRIRHRDVAVDHPGVALLSATGSTRMGRAVGPRVAGPLRPLPARARGEQRRRS